MISTACWSVYSAQRYPGEPKRSRVLGELRQCGEPLVLGFE